MSTGDSLPRPARIGRGPLYPVSLRNGGITGHVIAAFVIDTTGRVEARSITFLGPSAHPAFQQSVCKFLQNDARFVPGRAGGVPRRTLVFMPFGFSLSTEPALGQMPDARALEASARALPREQLVAELENSAHC